MQPAPDAPDGGHNETGQLQPKSRVTLALVCLHASAVLYVLLGVGLAVLLLAAEADQPREPGVAFAMGVCMGSFCVALATGVEVVAYGVQRRKFWGWVAGLVVFGLYLPSAFLPLGLLGLWGLLAAGSRREFGVSVHETQPQTPGA